MLSTGNTFRRSELISPYPFLTFARSGHVTIDRRISMTFGCAVLLTACTSGALHAACEFAHQGEGRVATVLDARTFRLDDGREVRLAGIEPMQETATRGSEILAALIGNREVTLRGPDDRPDRYGRQPAFVFAKDSGTSIQSELLGRGEAVASPVMTDAPCFAALLAAEAAARSARRGIWVSSAALKNAERPDDILAGKGRFAVVEGTISSAQLAGATFYVNFGRRWTRGFAVTISKRMMPSFEAAGIDLKSLKDKRVRARGWVEQRGGPRIEASHPGQIELIAAAVPVVTGDAAARDMGPKAEGR
jgi:endonuclease YncB( thermonuclease family)